MVQAAMPMAVRASKKVVVVYPDHDPSNAMEQDPTSDMSHKWAVPIPKKESQDLLVGAPWQSMGLRIPEDIQETLRSPCRCVAKAADTSNWIPAL